MESILSSYGILLIGLSIIVGYFYLTWNFDYWKKRGVKGLKPKVMYGTFPGAIRQKHNMVYDIQNMYNKYKNTENFVGCFSVRNPELLILNPQIVSDILIKNFKNFHDNSVAFWIDKEHDKMGASSPFFMTGYEWKEKRAEITPALTTNRIKATFPVMQQACDKMKDFIANRIRDTPKGTPFDAKKLATRYTAEVIADYIYGVEAGAFTSNSPIFAEAEQILDSSFTSYFKFLLTNAMPFMKKLMSVNRFIRADSQRFFGNLMYEAIEIREKQNNDRVDFLNYLLQIKEKKSMTNFHMAAHAMTFFLDGFDTSATVISNLLLCLGRNQSAQNILRKEIADNVGEDGNLTFDKLHDMTYLHQCIMEALRILPPCLFSSKTCSEPFELQNADGRVTRIEKGIPVYLPYYCFQHDEEYFPNAEEFIPERFTEGMAKKWGEEGKFLPFTDGPRICIGKRFGLVKSKLAVCEIVKNFKITVAEKTRNDSFVDKTKFITMLKGGVWLHFTEIK